MATLAEKLRYMAEAEEYPDPEAIFEVAALGAEQAEELRLLRALEAATRARSLTMLAGDQIDALTALDAWRSAR